MTVTPPHDHLPGPVVVLEFSHEIPPRTFAGILPERVAEAGVRRIDPLACPGIADEVTALRTQGTHWASSVREAGRLPSAVLAYCSASALAAELVAALPEPGVPLILFDPEYPDRPAPQSLLEELAQGIDDSGERPPAPAITDLPPQQALAAAGAHLRSLVARSAPDLDRAVADELTAGQRAWMSFVLSASAAPPTAAVKPWHVFLSEKGTWAGAGEVPVSRTGESPRGLFTSPSVKAALFQVLALVGACR
ncbi:hypothetical protein [Streptomyces albus]|uniref:hypothetical protein n=1 Tax=Streptomyces albus TaxID=1888 RepID=UPI0033D01C89